MPQSSIWIFRFLKLWVSATKIWCSYEQTEQRWTLHITTIILYVLTVINYLYLNSSNDCRMSGHRGCQMKLEKMWWHAGSVQYRRRDKMGCDEMPTTASPVICCCKNSSSLKRSQKSECVRRAIHPLEIMNEPLAWIFKCEAGKTTCTSDNTP